MPGLEASNVVVASFGHIYIAPEGTALPADVTTPLPAAWEDIGYVGEDGVTFTLSRDTEDIMAWQSTEAVRRLVTAEPKELAFELLEFDPESVQLAFRGGSMSKTGTAPDETAIYEPPVPGAESIKAACVEWLDGDDTWRFCAKRVEVSGDVEFVLTRTDAIRLPLTLAILAADPPGWTILSDDEAWLAQAVVALGTEGAPAASATRSEWDAYAESVGVDPSEYGSKDELIAAVEQQTAAPA
jgi:hypothetical protein